MVNQQWQQLAKDVADNQDEAEHENREEQIDQQLAADESVKQFHLTTLLAVSRSRKESGI